MELPSLDALGALFGFVWPGVLALQIYRLIMPARPVEWKEVLSQGLFYTVLNYLAFFPAALFILNRRNVESSPLVYWGCLVLLFFVGPILLAFAYKYAHKWKWLKKVVNAPYPTSWDYLFAQRRPIFALVHLKNGRMVGGYWGEGSYASSYPHEGDLYLSAACKVDADGRFTEVVDRTRGLLIRRDEFSYLELFAAEPNLKSHEDHDNGRRAQPELSAVNVDESITPREDGEGRISAAERGLYAT